AKVEREGACGKPKCRSLPSLAASPPVISRNDLAPPSWQNNMATNCPQLLKPRACRSALRWRTAASKLVREISWRICEKMLHTLFKAESSSDSFCLRKTNLSETRPFSFLYSLKSEMSIWTRVVVYSDRLQIRVRVFV